MSRLEPYGWVAVWKKESQCRLCGGLGYREGYPLEPAVGGVWSSEACDSCEGKGRVLLDNRSFNIDDPEMADETEPEGEGWILDEVYPAEMEDTTLADDAYEVDR